MAQVPIVDKHKVKQLEAQRLRDPQANLPLIHMYEELLGRLQSDETPALCASINNDLGVAYSQLLTGSRTTNLERAVACYQEALRLRTPETAPLDYALTQMNLGITYWKMLTGDRTTNLERAIACYQEALRYQTPEIAVLAYAKTQMNLGNAYRDLPSGNQAVNLEKAIAYYHEALRFWTPETAPLDYARAKTNLGIAYRKLPIGNNTINLEQAIACYLEALRFRTPEIAPLDYAMTQMNLGNAYGDLPTGDRVANVMRAITCYHEALRFRTPETAPLDYAWTQYNLGVTYRNLLMGDRTANLTQALACSEQALRFWTLEVSPLDFALAQNSLGNIYSDLSTGDRTANLTRALACYEQALHVYIPEAAPLDYARVQGNLGLAYWQLPTGDRTANLTQALACHEQALRFYTPEATPLDYARVQGNLGLIYWQLPTGDQTANLTHAIVCYEQALRFYTPEATPLDYARVQNNLGIAYRALPTGDRTANLTRAIACYEQALRFWTPEAAPLDYAMAQNNLGLIYSDLPTGDRSADLTRAIACYQEALRFRTLDAAPFDCRATNRNLANLYFNQKDWKTALDVYQAAMDAGERLYLAGLSSENKAVEMADNVSLYRYAAFSAFRCGQKSEALLILERGKTRLLVEALRLRVHRPANVPDDVWIAFEQAGAAMRAAQTRRTATPEGERDLVEDYAARVEQVRAVNAALDAAIEHVRIHAPQFLHPISMSTIQKLLPDDRTVLVAFCITSQGSLGFVVGREQEVQLVEVPTFTQGRLRGLFAERDADGRAIGGWLGAYNRSRIEGSPGTLSVWQDTITNILAELGHGLLAPILSALPSSAEHLILLPSAELFLLPLHAAPLSDKNTERVCDRYQVSYAPSTEVLAEAQARVVQEVIPDLYAVINPQADPRLVFTQIEGAAIARLFSRSSLVEGPTGTKQQVVAGVRGRTYVHFSCHGSYNWDVPAESGLALADGRLTLAELQQDEVDLSMTRLVTLSACETGITDVVKGSAEEYVGIPAGFLLAGVPCVLSSLWAVDDFSTSLLIEEFYKQHLVEGQNIVHALHRAQLWLRTLSCNEVMGQVRATYGKLKNRIRAGDEISPADQHLSIRLEALQEQLLEDYRPEDHPFAHPYYWAAFLVSGAA